MEVEETALAEVLVLTPQRFGDERGWFSETWNKGALEKLGITLNFVQDNHSFSANKGTLRGLHYQSPPRAQDKLVRCTQGEILDVAVDARKGSPRYGQWTTISLSAKTGRQVLVPKGFLHGFVTLTDNVEVQYKCTDTYAPEADGSVRWDSVGIEWEISGVPELSAKDAAAPSFDDWGSPFQLET